MAELPVSQAQSNPVGAHSSSFNALERLLLGDYQNDWLNTARVEPSSSSFIKLGSRSLSLEKLTEREIEGLSREEKELDEDERGAAKGLAEAIKDLMKVIEDLVEFEELRRLKKDQSECEVEKSNRGYYSDEELIRDFTESELLLISELKSSRPVNWSRLVNIKTLKNHAESELFLVRELKPSRPLYWSHLVNMAKSKNFTVLELFRISEDRAYWSACKPVSIQEKLRNFTEFEIFLRRLLMFFPREPFGKK